MRVEQSKMRCRLFSVITTSLIVLLLMTGNVPFCVKLSPVVHADTTYQTIPSTGFMQDWSNNGLITTNDDWSGVPGITGYRGDGLTTADGTNPQTVIAPSTVVDVNANQTNPNTFTTGGVTEFQIANPTVALAGSDTADAPYLNIFLNTTGRFGIRVRYNLRDIDGSADNVVQQFALQYRVGSTGNYTNVPAGYVADATTGPNLATQVTPVNAVLPAEVNNQPQVEVRVITTNAAGSDEYVGVDDILITGATSPGQTVVSLGNFNASSSGNGTLLTWRTGYEVNNLGFNLYREHGGTRTRVNPSLIAGSAFLTSVALTAGQSYSWFDAAPPPDGYVQYWLEDIDLDGTRKIHGPFVPERGEGSLKNRAGAQAMLLSRLNATMDVQAQTGRPAALKFEAARVLGDASAVARQRTIAGGAAVKLGVRSAGWYRVTQPELVAAGLSPDVNPELLQLFRDGIEQPMVVRASGTRLAANDAIEFYGTGIDTRSTDTRTYYLVAGSQPGRRITTKSKGRIGRAFVRGTAADATSFLYTVERRDRVLRFAALLNGEADNFFGSLISAAPTSQILNVKQLAANNAQPVTLEVALQGGTLQTHQIKVSINNFDAGTVSFQNQERPVTRFSIPSAALAEGDNTVTLTALDGEGDLSVIDYLRLTYPRGFHAENDALTFSLPNGRETLIDGFTNPQVRVFDITDARAVEQVRAVVQPDASGFAVRVSANPTSRGGRIYLAIADNRAQPTSSIVANQPSTLSAATQEADFVIITHGNFRRSVEPLAAQRRTQGMKVVVADIEDVYDEFSFGTKSAESIKEFLAHTQSQWQQAPHSVLLVGDATYDPRNYLGQGQADYLPTKFVDTSSLETASDDAFTDYDADGIGDLATGRLAVRTASQADTVIAKITNFVPGQTSDSAMLVSDLEDGYNFEAATAQVRTLLPASTSVIHVNRALNTTEQVRQQIADGFNAGPMIVNYLGHGSIDVWTGSSLISSTDAQTLSNGNRLPFLVAMTCLNGAFHDIHRDSLAEALMKAENGGIVAAWASSGLTNPEPQAQINQELYRLLFGTELSPRLGDAVRAAKAVTIDPDVRRTWIFFGDPTMRLR